MMAIIGYPEYETTKGRILFNGDDIIELDITKRAKLIALAARMEFPIYSGAEMVEMLTAAGFSRAWFESVPDKASGWLYALGAK